MNYPIIEGVTFRPIKNYLRYQTYAVSSDGKVWLLPANSSKWVQMHPYDSYGEMVVWLNHKDGFGGQKVAVKDL